MARSVATRIVPLPLLIISLLAASPARSQEESYQADALLRKAAAAMGVDALSTLRYSAAGSGGGIGQPYTAGKAWPKQNLSLTRSVHFESGTLIDEVTRSRAGDLRGGTAVPLTGEQKLIEAVSGNAAWNVVGSNVVPGGRWVAERAPLVWLNPHGAIKAARRNATTLAWRTEGQRSLGAVSFTVPGVMKATLLINDQYLVERIEASVPNPVLGDMPVVTSFSEYRDFGAVKFPTRIEEKQGGFDTASLIVTDVQPNAKVDLAVPQAAREARETVTSQRLGTGVWLIAGGSHNSVAVEARDHVVVIEGPLYDDRAGPVIDEVKKLVPGKPIRQVVNTHVHFDHSGGLGAFVAEGATIVTHAANRGYYEKAFAAPRTIKADRFAGAKRKLAIRTVGDKLVLGDAGQPIELHLLRGNLHNDSLLVAYLPKDKLLVQADVFAPLPPNAPAPATPSPVTLNLAENIERLKLDVDRIVGIHGGVAPAAELKRALGR